MFYYFTYNIPIPNVFFVLIFAIYVFKKELNRGRKKNNNTEITKWIKLQLYKLFVNFLKEITEQICVE